MAVGTDKQILTDLPKADRTNGRPKKDRSLIKSLIKSGYSSRYIKQVCKCSIRTIATVRAELITQGELKDQMRLEELDRIGVDFDEEIKSAMQGMSFYDWVQTRFRNKHTAKHIFKFCKNTWEKIWDKPSIILLREKEDKTGDICCQSFLKFYGEDEQRIRDRKKRIRYFFRFIGRQDLNDLHLSMTKSKDPINKRDIPAITDMTFPSKIDQLIASITEKLGKEYGLAIRFKLVTMMRTGNRKTEREFLGLKRDTGKSWISFENEDRFKGKILAKGREEWGLDWIPKDIRKEVYELYLTRKQGDFLFNIDEKQLLKAMRQICPTLGLPILRLHDLRKVTITWFWSFGIDLSIATELNVGWKDLNTAKDHYLTIGDLLRRTDRKIYRDNIPAWFKEGLDEYLPIFFTNPQGAS